MRILVFLSILVFSCQVESQNVKSSDSYDFHLIERRQATTIKKPATTTAKPTTTTAKTTTTTTKPTTTTKKPTTTTTKKPAPAISNPDIKTHLTTASQVFTTLGDVKNAQAFAERYFQIQPVRLVSALKGVSIAAAIFASFIDIPDPETEKILNNMNTKFDTMFKKMDSQTSELKSYIDQKFLNTFILAPIKTAEDAMNTYKKKPNAATMAAFLERTKSAKLPEVVNHVLLNTRDFLINTMKNSRYNKSAVATMSGILVHSFHKSCLIEYYRNGIEFKDKLLVERMDTNNEYFRNTVSSYKKISDEVFNDLEVSFFPGFIEDDIVKPIIDQAGGDSCTKAEAILAKLNTNFPWRKYAVIVSDRDRLPKNSAYFGFPNRMIVMESYNGRFVLVFMATKDFEKKKKAYILAAEKKTIDAEAQKAFFINFDTMVDYARNGKKYYQMAALSLGQRHCLRVSDDNVIDSFAVKISVSTEFLGTVETPINYVVVF